MTPRQPSGSPGPDVAAAARALTVASAVVSKAARQVAAAGGPDVDQVVAYDLAHLAAGVRAISAEPDSLARRDREELLGYARDTWKSVAAMSSASEKRVSPVTCNNLTVNGTPEATGIIVCC